MIIAEISENKREWSHILYYIHVIGKISLERMLGEYISKNDTCSPLSSRVV